MRWGAIGLNMGGPSRGLHEKHFVKGKVFLFKEFQFRKDFLDLVVKRF